MECAHLCIIITTQRVQSVSFHSLPCRILWGIDLCFCTQAHGTLHTAYLIVHKHSLVPVHENISLRISYDGSRAPASASPNSVVQSSSASSPLRSSPPWSISRARLLLSSFVVRSAWDRSSVFMVGLACLSSSMRNGSFVSSYTVRDWACFDRPDAFFRYAAFTFSSFGRQLVFRCSQISWSP